MAADKGGTGVVEEQKPMKQPRFEGIVIAMAANRQVADFFLYTENGEVIMIPLELQLAIESLTETEEVDRPMPVWQQDLVPIAEAIYVKGDSCWLYIPAITSWEIYCQMVAFAESITNAQLRGLLARALDGPATFRQFKDVLIDFSQEQARWYQQKHRYVKQEARAWLEQLVVNGVLDLIA